MAALSVAIPAGVAYAQQQGTTQQVQSGRAVADPRFQQGGPVPPRQDGGQAFPGRPDMGQRGMMGGQATMVVDGQFLYILQGPMLFKVNKNTLETVQTGMLPMPMPMQPGIGGPEPGAPGFRNGVQGGPPTRTSGGGGTATAGGGARTGGGGTAK